MPEENTTPEMTPEQIELERKRAQAYDLVAFVEMFMKQAKNHGYVDRPEEVAQYEDFRVKLAEKGLHIPALVQQDTIILSFTVKLPYTDELREQWPSLEGSHRELDYAKFEAWWKENVGRDKAKFARFFTKYKPKPERMHGHNTALHRETTTGPWPEESKELHELGQQVIAEIKAAATADNANTMEVF